MSDDVVLQAPAAPARLFLLFHGFGATPRDLVPLGSRLAGEFPDAAVVSVAAPDRSDVGGGRQWFQVTGVTERNRPARVAATLPRFLAAVQDWQQRLGVTREGTTLVGFSQGAILALASTQQDAPPAARVVSLSGRFPALPKRKPAGVRIHLLHGTADPLVPAVFAEQAATALQELGADVTLDRFPGLAHGISRGVEDRLLARLRG
jgi:phospholipase/carboxylesterase